MNSRDKVSSRATAKGPLKGDKITSNQNTNAAKTQSNPKSTSETSKKHNPHKLDGSTPSRRKNTENKDNSKKTVSSTSKEHAKRYAPISISNKSTRRETNTFKNKIDEKTSSSIQEMATTGLQKEQKLIDPSEGDDHLEQETNVDGHQNTLIELQETDDDENLTLLDSQATSSSSASLRGSKFRGTRSNTTPNDLDKKLYPSPARRGSGSQSDDVLPIGWQQHSDKLGPYFIHESTGTVQRNRPTRESRNGSLVVYHDDEEINQISTMARTSSEDDDYLESGAALTLADESSATYVPSEAMNFVVYPIGCCEFDETELVSSNNTRAIQKCILRLSSVPCTEETKCWGLDQSQPILMRLVENYIQFSNLKDQSLYKSQPINSIKTWAVDDDNNFAFVVEERANNNSESKESDYYDSVDYALLTGPTFVCYVFSSIDDDDMSCRLAAKLNEEINKYKEQMSRRIIRSTKLQQMIEPERQESRTIADDRTDVDDDVDGDSDEANETTIDVNYIGMVRVPRPVGIDVLNVAIDKSLADASKKQTNRLLTQASTSSQLEALETGEEGASSPLTEVKLHVSPSSVIVESAATGEIIVECRIRYLTFMGISRRDIRWCGFIMQNITTKTFEAHCFECYPTAGHVCEAIQASCTRMYQKMVKSQIQQEDDMVTSIIPKSSKIRDTLAKTFSRIKLAPIIQ